jgi:hypothetical protein
MIYFVRILGTDHVKIGYSKDRQTFKGRLQSLQTGQPWKLEVLRTIDDAEQWLESWFHQVFAGARQHGEWFTYNPVMMELVPDFETLLRRQPRMQAREALCELVERLMALLDSWTPDEDAEPEDDDEPESDGEPDAEGYVLIRAADPLPATHDQIRHEDAEQSEVEVDAY